jgi:predicted kinase
LAEEIARFHSAAAPVSGLDAVAAMRGLVETNRDRLLEHGGLFNRSSVQAMTEAALSVLGRTQPLIAGRSAKGWVRHCHGDLHLGNVALIDGHPVLFDAIEFNPAFAEIDVYYDLAFVLMDLEHCGLSAFANLLLATYLELTEDYGGLALLPLYLSVRAGVRAHVGAAAAALESDTGRADELRANARRYFDAAELYLAPASPCLVAIGGVSGTGKSTLARLLAPALGAAPGAVVLRSDMIRKRMFGAQPTERLPQSAYTSEVSRRVFARIAETAGIVLAAGHACIADAVYGEERQRRAVRAVARDRGVAFSGFWLEAPAVRLEDRIRHRTGDVSDADARVLRSQLDHVTPPRDWVRLDASTDAESVAAAALPHTPTQSRRRHRARFATWRPLS